MKRRRVRNTWLRYKYGLTLEEYESRLAAQGGRCAICRRDGPGEGERAFAVDHCHQTGEVRGIICSRCNVALAAIGDSFDAAMRFVNYLRGWPACRTLSMRGPVGPPRRVTVVRYVDADGRRTSKRAPGARPIRTLSRTYYILVGRRRVSLGTDDLHEASRQAARLFQQPIQQPKSG